VITRRYLVAKLPVAIDLINAPFWVLAAISTLLWLTAVLLALAGLRDYSLVTSMLSVPAVIHAARVRKRSRGGAPNETEPRQAEARVVQTTEELSLTRVPGHLILGWLFCIVAFLLVWFATSGR
jgi:hypothetical protein